MPDVVYIDSGTDTPVSTDFVNIDGVSQHVQRIKLIDGTDGSSAFIPGDSIYGLSVDVKRLPEFVLSSQASPFTSDLTITGNVNIVKDSVYGIDTKVTDMPDIVLASQSNPFTDDINITGNVNILSMPSISLATQSNPFSTPIDISGSNLNLAAQSSPFTTPINVSGSNLVVYPYCHPSNIKQYSATITDSGDYVAIAGAVSTYMYITHISVMNSHLTTGTAVFITDGSLGSNNLYCGYAGANGGRFTSSFLVPLRSTIGSGINFHATTSGTNLYVNINGYSSTV